MARPRSPRARNIAALQRVSPQSPVRWKHHRRAALALYSRRRRPDISACETLPTFPLAVARSLIRSQQHYRSALGHTSFTRRQASASEVRADKTSHSADITHRVGLRRCSLRGAGEMSVRRRRRRRAR